jgi:hypothetical protein
VIILHSFWFVNSFYQKILFLPDKQHATLSHECGSIRRMLIASINTTKENQQ